MAVRRPQQQPPEYRVVNLGSESVDPLLGAVMSNVGEVYDQAGQRYDFVRSRGNGGLSSTDSPYELPVVAQGIVLITTETGHRYWAQQSVILDVHKSIESKKAIGHRVIDSSPAFIAIGGEWRYKGQAGSELPRLFTLNQIAEVAVNPWEEEPDSRLSKEGVAFYSGFAIAKRELQLVSINPYNAITSILHRKS